MTEPMKLQIIKRARRGGGCQERLVSVNRKGGYFSFNTQCTQQIGLNTDSRMLIAKDEDSRCDWYVAFDKGQSEGMKLTPQGKQRESSYRVQHKTAAEALLNAVKAERGATFLIAAKPVHIDGIDWYRIMTANPLSKR